MLSTISILITMLMSSVWSEFISPESIDCGRVYTSNSNIPSRPWATVYELQAEFGAVPWSAGIYKKHKYDFYLIGGGSLISTNLVVTVAHLVLLDRSEYKIALGKYTRNISTIDNDFTQIIDVEKIYTNKFYNGSKTYYANNIAIIVLATQITTSNTVLPACVDWTARYTVPNGSIGKMASFGNTQEGVVSSVLLEKYLPYVDRETCRNWHDDEFKNYITNTTFCGGSVSVSGGVQMGDSGSGLMFIHNDRYFLTGLASIKDPSRKDSVSVFTDARIYIDWLREAYNNAHTTLL